MGLSTHVLDTMHGCPAAGMDVSFYHMAGAVPQMLARFALNADGRNPSGLLLDNATVASGRYRLVFDVAGYFRAKGVALPEPPFLDVVTVDFGIADVALHYHVPLLCSPWSHATYRGS